MVYLCLKEKKIFKDFAYLYSKEKGLAAFCLFEVERNSFIILNIFLSMYNKSGHNKCLVCRKMAKINFLIILSECASLKNVRRLKKMLLPKYQRIIIESFLISRCPKSKWGPFSFLLAVFTLTKVENYVF